MSGRSLRALACAMAGCSVWYVAIVCALFVGQAGAQGSTAANAGSGLYYTADDGFAMLHQRGGRKPYKEKEDSNDRGGRKPYKEKEDSNDRGGRKPYKEKEDTNDRGGRKPYKKKEDNNDVNRDCIELNEMFDEDDLDRVSNDIRPIVKRTVKKFMNYMFDSGKLFKPKHPLCKPKDMATHRNTVENIFLKLVKENLQDREKFGKKVTFLQVRKALQRSLRNLTWVLPELPEEQEDPSVDLLILKAINARTSLRHNSDLIGGDSRAKNVHAHRVTGDPAEELNSFKKAIKSGTEEIHEYNVRTKQLNESRHSIKDEVQYLKAKMKKESMAIEHEKITIANGDKHIKDLKFQLKNRNAKLSALEDMRNS